MTVGIMPELDREGSSVCQFWLQAPVKQYTIRLQQTRNLPDLESPRDLRTPPSKGMNEGVNKVHRN